MSLTLVSNVVIGNAKLSQKSSLPDPTEKQNNTKFSIGEIDSLAHTLWKTCCLFYLVPNPSIRLMYSVWHIQLIWKELHTQVSKHLMYAWEVSGWAPAVEKVKTFLVTGAKITFFFLKNVDITRSLSLFFSSAFEADMFAFW